MTSATSTPRDHVLRAAKVIQDNICHEEDAICAARALDRAGLLVVPGAAAGEVRLSIEPVMADDGEEPQKFLIVEDDVVGRPVFAQTDSIDNANIIVTAVTLRTAALPLAKTESEAGASEKEEAAWRREQELHEIADGAFGDNPHVRARARDMLAKNAVTSPAPVEQMGNGPSATTVTAWALTDVNGKISEATSSGYVAESWRKIGYIVSEFVEFDALAAVTRERDEAHASSAENMLGIASLVADIGQLRLALAAANERVKALAAALAKTPVECAHCKTPTDCKLMGVCRYGHINDLRKQTEAREAITLALVRGGDIDAICRFAAIILAAQKPESANG